MNLWWFVDTAVVSEVLLFGLEVFDSFFWGSVLQPWDGAVDPFQQLKANMKMMRRHSTKLTFMVSWTFFIF